jgi:hypothetical protein
MMFQLQTDKDPFQFHIRSRASSDVTSGLFIRGGYALPFLFYLSECEQNRFVSGGSPCANSGLVGRAARDGRASGNRGGKCKNVGPSSGPAGLSTSGGLRGFLRLRCRAD